MHQVVDCVYGQPAGLPALASPLSIAEAVETALRENPSIRGALATAQAAQARIGQARSTWLPQVTASSQVRADTSYQTGVAQGAEAVNTLRYSGGCSSAS